MNTEETQALVVAEPSTNYAVGRALSVNEIKERLAFIRDVMATVMTDGQDYGKVPGCGDKPGLFQPGAQKLSMTFQLNPEVRQETVTDYQNGHRGYRLIVRVTNGAKFADGVGEGSTMESKYRFRAGARKCPKCGKETIIKGKAEYGGGWLCFGKKGGCGEKWPDGAPEIESQSTERVEHDNPADFWNTARKMAFKRAFVHAIINATNTSELWSQDLEDLADNASHADTPAPPKPAPNAPKTKQEAAKPVQTPKAPPEATEEQKQRFLSKLKPVADYAKDYAVAKGWILDTEDLADIPLRHVPTTVKAFEAVMADIQSMMDDQLPGAEAEPDAGEFTLNPPNGEPWRNLIVPFGKNKGERFGDLDKKSLWWWIMVWKPEAREFKGKVYQPTADDLALYDEIQKHKPAIVARYDFKEPTK